MAQIHELPRKLLPQRSDRLPAPVHLPRARLEQPAENAQQAGLPAPVGAADPEQITLVQGKRQPAEQRPLAALAMQVPGLQHGSIVTESGVAQPSVTKRQSATRSALLSAAGEV